MSEGVRGAGVKESVRGGVGGGGDGGWGAGGGGCLFCLAALLNTGLPLPKDTEHKARHRDCGSVSRPAYQRRRSSSTDR